MFNQLLSLIFFLGVAASNLQAKDFKELSFNAWSVNQIVDGETIKIRGFLTQKENGQWYLSNHPHIDSCCLGVMSKDKKSLYLENFKAPDSFDSSKVYPIVGKIHFVGAFNEDSLVLTDGFIIKEISNAIIYLTLFIALAISLIMLALLVRKQRTEWKEERFQTER